MVQSMPDASPAKWHRAHTTWFFEQFLLVAHMPGYRVFDERFAISLQLLLRRGRTATCTPAARIAHAAKLRADRCLSCACRCGRRCACSRQQIARELTEIVRILEIGLNHEQQHQELLLTDILHAFAANPISPAYDVSWQPPPAMVVRTRLRRSCRAAFTPSALLGEGYCFDNETPAHPVCLQPARIARSLVSNAQWLEFMEDGGYATPSLWLSDGWTIVEAEGWNAPGYWRDVDGAWVAMTLAGLKPVEPQAPVAHISYYEADAFARWAGKHLPTEQEWEIAARAKLLDDAFGHVWQWTRSAYLPYPGYRAAPDALGEYNGKFMINQMVLRGSSHATPNGHARASYRNFFYPQARWQFSGVRLLDYAEPAQTP